MPFTINRQTKAALSTLSTLAAMAVVPPVFAQSLDGDIPKEADALTQQVNAAVQKASAATGLEFTGYIRTGFYSASGNDPKGGYALGGDLQFYRLGNEGNNYMDFGVGKKFDLGEGLKWGVYYMPKVYNGTSGTSQIYSEIGGFSFAPELKFWAGQRFHRIADVHILDNWYMEDGDNYGAGVDGFKVGSGSFNIAVQTDGNMDNQNTSTNNGKRINLQLKDLVVNPGGKLNLHAGAISGDFAQGSNGAAFGFLHLQSDFLVKGLENSFAMQTASGHASLLGKFYNLDDNGVARAGAKQFRVLDAINWQIGRFGGQALVGYQTLKPDVGAKIKDFSLGGRVSYGVARQVKLLAEVGTTRREIDGQDSQRLNKGTLAVALSPNTNFWTRPELRVYATRANWNDAAARANSTSFGMHNQTKGTAFGVQMEAWW